MSKKPFKSVGITKDLLIARMISSDDPKIRALAPKLTAVKEKWTVDQLYEVLCEMAGKDPSSVLSRKG
jgi:hypothetical protein